MRRFDVVVIGAGHAGCEAALAASRLGAETALVTITLGEIGKMPCNPAIGGPGKSQLVREVDALGGGMARVTDESMIHIRMLNTSKGPAMQVRRAQADRDTFKASWRSILESVDGLEIVEGMVDAFIVREGRIAGVRLREDRELGAGAVILCAGTFLNGKVLLGEEEHAAGRAGEPPSVALAQSLRNLGFDLQRMKTGTPPRVHRDTIDVDALEAQPTSDRPLAFSYGSEPRVLSDLYPVYVTHTNERTHEIISENLQRSAVYNGLMDGVGPRHCPSLETKIVRFPGRTSHKVFCEPEGRESPEVYLQGIYTAFSPRMQDRIVHSIRGLEAARIERYGYNIEYDSVDPQRVHPSLESRDVPGLYLAGQIIGTTGYEEAAALGLLAGVNAVRSLRDEAPVVLDRGQAFAGVLVDDLVTKGISEPYRMLPSRAEYRITLREGNADLRLSELGHEIGLLSDDRYEAFVTRREAVRKLIKHLRDKRVGPSDSINKTLVERGSPPLSHNGAALFDLLRRPEIGLADLVDSNGNSIDVCTDVSLEAEIEGKYAGYLAQQDRDIERLRRMERIPIPDAFDFGSLEGVSMEGRDLLGRVCPRTFGQASRVPGVSQADLSMLAIHLRRT